MSCKKILLIDDDPAICQTMQDVLEIYGYHIVSACDGLDGIKKLKEMESVPCLILLDLMMPGMNGWGFLDYQKADPQYSSIPVIICSAYEASAKAIGSSPVLIKPVQLSSLVGAVKAFCA